MFSSFITCNHIVYMLIYSSLQINLPESVSKRYHHSMTTYEISNGHVWLIVTGGCSGYDRSMNTAIPITGSDVTYIIDLGMIINMHIMCYISDHFHVYWNH